jgi:hypothetical protein
VRACRKATLGSIDTVLFKMAECGFASVSTIQDPAPKFIAQENVGGLVDTHATVVGLPIQVRGSAELGVVPTSHYIRHVIAKERFNFPSTNANTSDPAA